MDADFLKNVNDEQLDSLITFYFLICKEISQSIESKRLFLVHLVIYLVESLGKEKAMELMQKLLGSELSDYEGDILDFIKSVGLPKI